jgi:hypothetical protein
MRVFALASIVLVAPALGGCFFLNEPGGSGSGSGAGGPSQTEADIKDYDSTKAELDQHRTVFLKSGASDLNAITTRLFWLEFPTYDPTLHSFETTAQASVNYGFSIGTADTFNYRASENLIVVAEVSDQIIYHVYANDQPNTQLASFAMDPPSDEQRWWAYAPDHQDVYVVTTGAETKLLKWSLGDDMPQEVLTFEKVGIQVGEFWDFGVDSGRVTLIESGRAWTVDLATQKANYLGNKTEADGAWPDTDGVLLETAEGPFFYNYATGKISDVGAAIKASNFELNKTFAASHLYDTGGDSPTMTRFHDNVGYVAESGIFNFNLSTGKVSPILLDARDNSVVYRFPVFLDDGSVFVHGLISNDGAIGADGPVYRVDFGF